MEKVKFKTSKPSKRVCPPGMCYDTDYNLLVKEAEGTLLYQRIGKLIDSCVVDEKYNSFVFGMRQRAETLYNNVVNQGGSK